MVIEITGDPGIGKSTYALSLIDDNKIILYINADKQLNTNYMRDNMFILQENNINEIVKIINNLINNIDIIVLDSLPSLNDGEGLVDINTNKILSGVQKLISLCNRNKCDLIIVNQERYSNKGVYTYGLNRLNLYYSKRIKITENGIVITKDKRRVGK